MNLALRFLGVGSAQAVELGSSGAVIERDGKPVLLIDCGPETLTTYMDAYGEPPRAVYVTHTHMDHVAGLERLFYRVYFDAALRGPKDRIEQKQINQVSQARIMYRSRRVVR